MELNCLGCQLANKLVDIKLLHEDTFFTVILDQNPINPGHILILPKFHLEHFTDLSEDLVMTLKTIIHHYQTILSKTFGYTDFTIQMNEGRINTLNHHFVVHLIPREKDDGVYLSTSKIEEIDIDKIHPLLGHF